MLTSILLILAAAGWLISVVGAVLQHHGAAKLDARPVDGTFTISTSEAHARWGLSMVIVGASIGSAGTILGVLSQSDPT